VEALKTQQEQQARDRLIAGNAWHETGLVFTTAHGTQDAGTVRKMFRRITRRAGIGTEWTPRQLRHTFVSLMSETGMPVEEIARLVGHSSTQTTETVYRHELRPVIRSGADAMDKLFPAAPISRHESGSGSAVRRTTGGRISDAARAGRSG
jgi:integrase